LGGNLLVTWEKGKRGGGKGGENDDEQVGEKGVSVIEE